MLIEPKQPASVEMIQAFNERVRYHRTEGLPLINGECYQCFKMDSIFTPKGKSWIEGDKVKREYTCLNCQRESTVTIEEPAD